MASSTPWLRAKEHNVVTHLELATLQIAPRPQRPTVGCPLSNLSLPEPLEKLPTTRGCRKNMGGTPSGSSCLERLLKKSWALSQGCTPPEQTPGHSKRRCNTRRARCSTEAVHRSVQATLCKVLGSTVTFLLAVLQSQLAKSPEGAACQRPSSLYVGERGFRML